MTKPYLQWIDQEITRHQTEIARLTVARSVIEEASEAVRPPPLVLPKPPEKKRRVVGNTRDHIKEALREIGQPSLPGTITAAVRAKHPDVTRKAIANGLYNARQVGEIVRSDDGLYALAEPKPAEDAAA